MEQSKVTQDILRMLAKQLGKKTSDVTPEKRVKEDLGADSLVYRTN